VCPSVRTYVCTRVSEFKTVSKDDSGYITQLKQQKIKKCDIT